MARVEADDDARTELPSRLGSVVRGLRTERGLSMRSLAAEAGVSQPFLSKLESGRLLPSLATLYGLAQALGVEPTVLLPDVIRSSPTSEAVHLMSSEAAGTPRARLLSGGSGRLLEGYEFTAQPGDADDVDFAHEGEEIVYVIDGTLVLEQEGSESRMLVAGESVTLDPALPHRWSSPASSDGPCRYLLVTTGSGRVPRR